MECLRKGWEKTEGWSRERRRLKVSLERCAEKSLRTLEDVARV